MILSFNKMIKENCSQWENQSDCNFHLHFVHKHKRTGSRNWR